MRVVEVGSKLICISSSRELLSAGSLMPTAVDYLDKILYLPFVIRTNLLTMY